MTHLLLVLLGLHNNSIAPYLADTESGTFRLLIGGRVHEDVV